jgi:hypothetical protein
MKISQKNYKKELFSQGILVILCQQKLGGVAGLVLI